jgi:hypothetical protein
MRALASLLLLLSGCWHAAADAHSQSGARLTIELDDGRPRSAAVDLALIDLLQRIPVDSDGDGRLTWGEVLQARDPIAEFVTGGLAVAAGPSACDLAEHVPSMALTRYADVPYLRLHFGIRCPHADGDEMYTLRYELFFDINPAHAALLRVTGSGREGADVLSDGRREVTLAGGEPLLSGAAAFVGEGFRHILSGYDHLAFVLLLILPVAGCGLLRQRAARIAAIVTAFTVAHSITLAAAVTGLVALPAQPVEMAIAGSVAVAGIMNVVRPGHTLGFRIAFCFGLLHGFGFAGALGELGLQGDALLVDLLAFNLGVELGQLLVVALVLPILALLSMSARYHSLLVPAASLGGAAAGALWVAQSG